MHASNALGSRRFTVCDDSGLHLLEGLALLWSEACRFEVALGIMNINGLSCAVEISSQDDTPILPQTS